MAKTVSLEPTVRCQASGSVSRFVVVAAIIIIISF